MKTMDHLARLAVVEQHAKKKFLETLDIVLMLIDNILQYPNEAKYRQVLLKNRYVTERIVNVKGTTDYMTYLGFEIQGEFISYPSYASLRKLIEARVAVQRKLTLVDNGQDGKMRAFISRDFLYSDRTLTPKQPEPDPSTSQDFPSITNLILRTIEERFESILMYEDKKLLKEALSKIPVVTLQIRAMERTRLLQKGIKDGSVEGPDLCFEISLLLELMDWFKNSFFQWVDVPQCDYCGGETKYSHRKFKKMTIASATETCRVEVYLCAPCNEFTYFPRYNNPRTLLRTRRGRCGEWANCFTLMCRALGYDARYVLDTKDHVWTEIYNTEAQRWMHVDVCENAIDIPLMYEHGWGKRLEYVLAFSRDEVQDVTWRYTSDHAAALQRRDHASEALLVEILVRLRENRLKNVSKARRDYVNRRAVSELVELMVERKPMDNEGFGRISGSLRWRQARGEIRERTRAAWSVEGGESVSLTYCAARDRYRLRTASGRLLQELRGWAAGLYRIDNVFRMEEKDWKMVYWARQAGHDTGTVVWKFEVEEEAMVVMESFSLKVNTKTYSTGKIYWSFWTDMSGEKQLVFYNEVAQEKISAKELYVSATVSGGSGDVAWQHAQLFRQPLASDEPAFQLNLVVAKTLHK